jgi:hypothetical protein
MSAEAWLVIVGAVLNGAATWGVISTKLAWIRRDVDDLLKWKEAVVESGVLKRVATV